MMSGSLFIEPAPERAAYPEFRKRLRREASDRVWLARSDEPLWLGFNDRPWAIWARDREGNPYVVIELVGPHGEHREPGDWAIRALQRRHTRHAYGGQSGSAWAKARRARLDSQEQGRWDRSKRKARERADDLLDFGNKSKQVFSKSAKTASASGWDR